MHLVEEIVVYEMMVVVVVVVVVVDDDDDDGVTLVFVLVFVRARVLVRAAIKVVSREVQGAGRFYYSLPRS